MNYNETKLVLDCESANMPELKSCCLCGSFTRTEWTLREAPAGKVKGQIWACSHHDSITVWNKILSEVN